MWWMIVVSAASCLAVLFLFGRRNERAVRRDWELLLTPKGEKLYKSIEGRVQSEMALADLTYEEAFTVRELGSIQEAQKLLDARYRVIEQFSPDMLRLLAAMATFSRMCRRWSRATPAPARLPRGPDREPRLPEPVPPSLPGVDVRALSPAGLHPGPQLRPGDLFPASLHPAHRAQ
jgi:hypothetical protein